MKLFKKIWSEEKKYHGIFLTLLFLFACFILKKFIVFGLNKYIGPECVTAFENVIEKVINFLYNLTFSVLAGIISSYLFSISDKNLDEKIIIVKEQKQ